jgi:hypothetical protein
VNVSEQKAMQTSGDPGSLDAGSAVPASSDTQSQPVAASAQQTAGEVSDIDSPALVPGQGPAAETDAPTTDAPKTEAGKADAPRTPGKVLIMSAGDRNWRDNGGGPDANSGPNSPMLGKRRLAAMAAVVALATIAGALGGALATSALSHLAGGDAAGAGPGVLEATVARIDADILALKASVETTSKLGVAQFNKASDRLDKVEKAQGEPAAKLAKLSEAVDKLRVAPAAASAPVPAAPKDVTGSIAPPAATPPKVEVARLPTVEGWVLRDVAHGGALIESRLGFFEVYAGDPVPGLGRIDAIRRQDGRWVVVTSKGLVVAR